MAQERRQQSPSETLEIAAREDGTAAALEQLHSRALEIVGFLFCFWKEEGSGLCASHLNNFVNNYTYLLT